VSEKYISFSWISALRVAGWCLGHLLVLTGCHLKLDRLTPPGAAVVLLFVSLVPRGGGGELMGMRIWKFALTVMPVMMLPSMSQDRCTPV
jgi:hypothetical protein